jgi:hypothetical protein
VKVQGMHIQQIRLEEDEGKFQAEEQLEEARRIPARGMAEELSEMMVEQQSVRRLQR